MERVKSWRNANPGYWRKKSVKSQDTLQDLIMENSIKDQEVKCDLVQSTLQDLITRQPAVLIGLIGHLTGITLQDEIASFVMKMRDSGHDILFNSTGVYHEKQKSHLSSSCPQNPQSIQLGGSPSGP